MQLTWDETDHERVTAMNRKFNKDELLDMDFKAYLASSSEEEEGEGEGVESGERSAGGDPPADTWGAGSSVMKVEKKKKKSEEQISKYRELLRGIQDRDKTLQEDKDMEITWVPGRPTRSRSKVYVRTPRSRPITSRTRLSIMTET